MSESARALTKGLTSPDVSNAAAAIRLASAASPRPPFDLAGGYRQVFDQGLFPGCVACAMASALFLLKAPGLVPSPSFLYHVVAIELGGAEGSGELRILVALNALALRGVCRLDLHDGPLTAATASRPPTGAAIADALARRLGPIGPRMRRWDMAPGPSRVAWVKQHIDARHPVILVVELPAGYAPRAATTWRWRDSTLPSGAGAHCVLLTGYSDLEAAVRIQDSRGRSAFDGGCWWMNYSVFESRSCVEACIAITG